MQVQITSTKDLRIAYPIAAEAAAATFMEVPAVLVAVMVCVAGFASLPLSAESRLSQHPTGKHKTYLKLKIVK